jgi:ABC-2 type transport system permease protein
MALTNLRRWARTIAITFEITLRQNFTDAFVIFSIIVQPMIIAIIALWMLRERGGDYAIFVVVGSGMTGLWSSLLFISGNSVTEERWNGTLENLVAAPTPMQVVVLGKNLANVAQSLLSMVASYLLVVWLFQLDVQIAQPVLFVASIFFMVISFICFGLIMASLFIVTPAIREFQNGLEFPIYILCGFLFPIALLPGWTTPISYLLSPYWAARVLHGTATGTASLNEVLLCWGMMILFGVIYLAFSQSLFRYVLRKARVDATIGMQ